jgi:ABC-type glycerol-3-phosphate transport system substrate-binding protein
MRSRVISLAVVLMMAPLGTQAADLVVWWEKGFYPQEDQAVAEIIAAFEQKTGKDIELVQPTQDEILGQAEAALEAGQPPDFLFSTLSERYVPQGRTRTGSPISRAPYGQSSTCLTPMPSTYPRCSMA